MNNPVLALGGGTLQKWSESPPKKGGYPGTPRQHQPVELPPVSCTRLSRFAHPDLRPQTQQGSLEDTFCNHLKHVAFQHQNKVGNHQKASEPCCFFNPKIIKVGNHQKTSCNVQVFFIRMLAQASCSCFGARQAPRKLRPTSERV